MGYLDGIGGQKNVKRAQKLFEKAHAKGNMSATMTLAHLYRTGIGGKLDKARAEALYIGARQAESATTGSFAKEIAARRQADRAKQSSAGWWPPFRKSSVSALLVFALALMLPFLLKVPARALATSFSGRKK